MAALPCPFCHSKPTRWPSDHYAGLFAVGCYKCPCQPYVLATSYAEAENLWNIREASNRSGNDDIDDAT